MAAKLRLSIARVKLGGFLSRGLGVRQPAKIKAKPSYALKRHQSASPGPASPRAPPLVWASVSRAESAQAEIPFGLRPRWTSCQASQVLGLSRRPESTTSLSSAPWSPATATSSGFVSNFFRVTVPLGLATEFFRLRKIDAPARPPGRSIASAINPANGHA